MAANLTPIACIPGLGVDDLAAYVGKTVEDFCTFGYGKKKDSENHCAHFVSHALNIQVGTVCSALLPWRLNRNSGNSVRLGSRDNELAGLFTQNGKHRDPFKGATTRVNDVFNSIEADSKGAWEDRDDEKADCLIYATIPGNISKDRKKMGSMSRKHVGIHHDGKIYNYSNTLDQVVDDSLEQFQKKFKGSYGADVIFLWSAIPHVGAACVHRGGGVAASSGGSGSQP
jgi:hypothetical protein